MQRRPTFLIWVTVAAFGGVGCGSVNRDLQRRVAAEATGIAPAVEDDDEVIRLAETTADAGLSLPDDVALADQAGLEDFIRIALTANPSIRRAIRQAQALGYRVPQVTSLDDPMVNIVPPTGDMLETAGGMMGGTLGVSHKIPFPGKLGARGRMAEQTVRMALDALADARISTIAAVQRAYYAYDLADISIQITRESESLLRQTREVAAARYKVGAATQQDVLRTEVELYGLANQRITLEQQRATATAMLNSLMDRPVDAPLPRPRSFELAEVEWKLPQAAKRAVESSPRLARLQKQIGRDLEAVKLARLSYYPDLSVGFAYTFIGSGISPVADGSDAWNLALGGNLPVWSQRLRAGVLEGNAQVLSSIEEYREMRNLLFFQLQDALVKIDTQYRQGLLFRDVIVPRAWQTVEVSASAYRTGDLEFTALIDNWRKWLELSLAYQRVLAELEQRFADLQQLIGVRIPRIADHGGEIAPTEFPVASVEERSETP